MFDKNKFSERLCSLRKSRNLSHQTLAGEIGVSRQAIGRFENGLDYPHVNTLCTLADFFDVSLDYLTGRSDDP